MKLNLKPNNQLIIKITYFNFQAINGWLSWKIFEQRRGFKKRLWLWSVSPQYWSRLSSLSQACVLVQANCLSWSSVSCYLFHLLILFKSMIWLHWHEISFKLTKAWILLLWLLKSFFLNSFLFSLAFKRRRLLETWRQAVLYFSML